MLYSIDEIITSITGKPLKPGLSDTASDEVDAEVYLQNVFGPTPVRRHRTMVPLGSLRVLQPDLELWRYLRLCGLGQTDFVELLRRCPLSVVRGRYITGYPLLQGNHRALFALMHGMAEAPCRVYVFTDEDVAFRFFCACQVHYEKLDARFGRHDVVALRENYKDMLAKSVDLRGRSPVVKNEADLFSSRTKRYRELRDTNETLSERIPCISLDGYLQTIRKVFHIPADEIRLSEQTMPWRYLMMTQSAIEAPKLERIARTPALLRAPILVLHTREVDYVVVGHTRLRALMERGESEVQAIVIHAEHDGLKRFLDTQAGKAGYLFGAPGLRGMQLVPRF